MTPAEGKDGEGFRLNVVNALWGQKGFPFEQAFLDDLARNYGAGLRLLDEEVLASLPQVIGQPPIGLWATTREEALAYCAEVRRKVAQVFGRWPERTPLNLRITAD